MSKKIQDIEARLKLLTETPLLKYPSNSIGGHPNYDKDLVSQFIQLTENEAENEMFVNILLGLQQYLKDCIEKEVEVDYTSLGEKFPFIAREVIKFADIVVGGWVDSFYWTEWEPFTPPNSN